jgi:hypothetical protein
MCQHPDQKEEHRKELARQIEEYLANGGTITQCPPNAFTETDVEGKPKRKFSDLSHRGFVNRPDNRDRCSQKTKAGERVGQWPKVNKGTKGSYNVQSNI